MLPVEGGHGDPLIAIRDLKVYFPLAGGGTVKAVDGVYQPTGELGNLDPNLLTLAAMPARRWGWLVNQVAASRPLAVRSCGWWNRHPGRFFFATTTWPTCLLANCASIAVISK